MIFHALLCFKDNVQEVLESSLRINVPFIFGCSEMNHSKNLPFIFVCTSSRDLLRKRKSKLVLEAYIALE